MPTHYTKTTMHPQSLADFAKFAVPFLAILCKTRKVILAYSGMSGCALATAIAMGVGQSRKQKKLFESLAMIYVRRPNEHKETVGRGYAVEMSGWVEDGSINESRPTVHISHSLPIIVIVDDFICGGTTAQRILNELEERLWLQPANRDIMALTAYAGEASTTGRQFPVSQWPWLPQELPRRGFLYKITRTPHCKELEGAPNFVSALYGSSCQ